MSGFMYTILRPEFETSKELEERIANYARGEKVRLSRARRQLIEKGLAVVETELPEMTERERRTFQEKIERLYSLISKKVRKKTRKGGEEE